MRLRTDEFVFQPEHPAWGVGQVLGPCDGEPGWYRIFFLKAGEKEVNTRTVPVARLGIPEPVDQIRDMQSARWRRAHHRVYVVELSSEILEDHTFREENPACNEDQLCLYVGETGLSPEKRFDNHKRGRKANKYVCEYGQALLPEFYEGLDSIPWELAVRVEEVLARHLRSAGYPVWQK